MYKFTMPADKWDETAPDKQAIRLLIMKHQKFREKLEKKKRYYEGEHKILDEAERKNKLVCNHAKDIADTASSYFIGNPVSYKSSADIAALTEPLELTVWICLFTGSLLSIFTQKRAKPI